MQTHLRGVLLQPLVLIMSAGYPDCARSAPHRSDWVDSRLPRTIKITTECPALVNKFQMRHERSSMHAPHGDVEMYRVWEYLHLSVLRGKVHFLWSISYYRRFYPPSHKLCERCGNNYGWGQFEGSRCQSAVQFRDEYASCDVADRSAYTFPIFEVGPKNNVLPPSSNFSDRIA